MPLILKYLHISCGADQTTYETYSNGLILLETEKYSTSTIYGASLQVLMVNESNIELKYINTCLRYILNSSENTASYFYGSYYCGLFTDNADVLSSLSDCSGFSVIHLSCGNVKGAVLDFRNNTSLKTFRLSHNSSYVTVYLPSSCSAIRLANFAGTLDLSSLTSFSLYTFYTSRSNLIKILKTVSANATIDELNCRFASVVSKEDTDLSFFKDVYDSLGYKLNIKSICDYDGGSSSTYFKSLSGLEYITGLNTIRLYKEFYLNLSDISSLSSQAETLSKVILRGTAIADLSVFADMCSLQYLDLTGNPIANYTVDDNGNTVYNLQILANLNGLKSGATGSLTQLYLEDCPSVTDWSDLTSLSWTTFKYSN